MDGQHLVETIQKLKADITECMLRKFGGEIDLDDMEESILRRLVAEEQALVKDLIKAYERRIHDMQVSTHSEHQLFIFKHSLGRLLDYVYSVQLYQIQCTNSKYSSTTGCWEEYFYLCGKTNLWTKSIISSCKTVTPPNMFRILNQVWGGG